MFSPEQFLRPRRAALMMAAACVIAAQPARAVEASTNAAPVEPALPAPGFLNRQALSELRPEEGNPSYAAASDSGAISSQMAPQPALPSSPTVSDSPQTLASATLASATPPPSSDPAPADPSAPAARGDSGNAWKVSYINLVNLLVQRGVLTKKDSSSLVTQAQQAASAESSVAQAQAPAPTSAAAAITPNPEDDTVHVDYVPETVKAQIRDEVKADVMKQARDENWAAPNAVPEWVTRYHVSADVRIRYEGDFFPDGNNDSGVFHNFNSINTGTPYDVGTASANSLAPSYDVNQNRNRFRIRARVGAAVDVGEGFTAGLRIGTGQDDNPVTENQTIGLANNAQGGNFSKYAVWLDRAFLRYELGSPDSWSFSATVGRMDNPFFNSTMLWANDLGFDGAVAQGKYKVADGVTPFLTLGAFPVFNTDFNFATTSPAKFDSEDKYLIAVQGGTTWQITKDVSFKAAGAYYYFDNVEGHVSDPFTPTFSSDQGNTDDSRPSFAQNGNTYIALRDIVPDASNLNGTINQFQYFGLATPFHEVALTAQLDFSKWDPFHISLQGEFVKNVAFDRSAIENNGPSQDFGPQNNLRTPGDPTTFVGGDTGYNARLVLGSPVLAKFLDWNVHLGYRYLESDAVVDAFTDSDFGGPLTGTNLKGYMIGGNVSLSSRVWTSVEWMSADSISGPTYKNDLIQFDINAKF